MRTVSGCSAAGVLNSIQENVSTRKKKLCFQKRGSEPGVVLSRRSWRYCKCFSTRLHFVRWPFRATTPRRRVPKTRPVSISGRSQLLTMNGVEKSNSAPSETTKKHATRYVSYSTGVICMYRCVSVRYYRDRGYHTAVAGNVPRAAAKRRRCRDVRQKTRVESQ